MSSSAGQKVTTDPETFYNPKNENPGVVTSDSLAAESIQEGGSFAANADSRGPMDQPSRSVNTNTTDTSNATVLPAAAHAEARRAEQGWSEEQELSGGRTKDAGVGPTYNIGSTSRSEGENARPAVGSGQGAPAPGYASHPAPSLGDNFKPKGANLQEGGFDSDAPNASFNTDIGSKNDPGRAALGKFQESNVEVSGGAGARHQHLSGGESGFDTLGDNASA